jgi:hypothetical protein
MPTTIALPTGNAPVPGRSRRRRVTPVVIAAGSVAVLGVTALMVTAHATTRHDQTSFTADGIRKLVVDQDAGNVTLVADTTAGHLRVTTTRSWAWQQPAAGHTTQGGVLTLTGDCPSFPGLGACAVDRTVGVPPGVTVQIGISSGNIHAAGLTLPDFGVTTDSGSIDATGMDVTAFSATTSSGNVRATLSGAPQRVNAATSSGDIQLTVPDAAYRVDAGTSAGQVRIGIAEDPSASRSVTAHTSSGDVILARG